MTNKSLKNRIKKMIELNHKMSELFNEYQLDSSKVKEKSFTKSIDSVLCEADRMLKKHTLVRKV